MRKLFKILQQDFAANRSNPKGLFLVVFYRLAASARALPKPLWILCSPILVLYILVVEWILGVELGYRVVAGEGLAIHHGQGLVVNNDVVLGRQCVLRHGVTLGNRHPGGPSPVVGNNVEFGANATVLGGVKLGDGCKVGAGAVVLADVPPGCVAVGNPARVIYPKESSAE